MEATRRGPARKGGRIQPPARIPRPDAEDVHALADRLHSAAIHLLRRVRVEDAASGLSASRLSALSVIVFSGPVTVGDLARMEQVSVPTISRMVRDMEARELVERIGDPGDRRVQRLRATPVGVRLLEEGRRRRVGHLAGRLEALSAADRRTLARAAAVMEEVSLPPGHFRHPG